LQSARARPLGCARLGWPEQVDRLNTQIALNAEGAAQAITRTYELKCLDMCSRLAAEDAVCWYIMPA